MRNIWIGFICEVCFYLYQGEVYFTSLCEYIWKLIKLFDLSCKHYIQYNGQTYLLKFENLASQGILAYYFRVDKKSIWNRITSVHFNQRYLWANIWIRLGTLVCLFSIPLWYYPFKFSVSQGYLNRNIAEKIGKCGKLNTYFI